MAGARGEVHHQVRRDAMATAHRCDLMVARQQAPAAHRDVAQRHLRNTATPKLGPPLRTATATASAPATASAASTAKCKRLQRAAGACNGGQRLIPRHRRRRGPSHPNSSSSFTMSPDPFTLSCHRVSCHVVTLSPKHPFLVTPSPIIHITLEPCPKTRVLRLREEPTQLP